MHSKLQFEESTCDGAAGASIGAERETAGHAQQALERQLFDRRRFPTLGRSGRALLLRMRQHAAAPLFRDFSGHRLTASALWQARWQHALTLHQRVPPAAGGGAVPAWVAQHLHRCARSVPAHAGKARGIGLFAQPIARSAWSALPTMDRRDLATRLAAHMPRGTRLDELICFSTSGTTGHPLRVPSHPLVAIGYYAQHCRALRLHGIVPRAGRGEVGIVLAGYQRRCFGYVSVNPLQRECGIVKLNLHPDEWRCAADRERYLDALAPELISGDPVSLSELARLDLRHRPRALLSTSMSLQPALRAALEARFDCPVLDLYSMNEAGPIGVHVDALDGHALLQPRLWVEILDEAGRALPDGEIGEVVLTGGFNPCLPLLRYRTGDHARLASTPLGPVLRDLQGREPIRFRTAGGAWINNVDVTQALAPFALSRFALHQTSTGAFELRIEAIGGWAPLRLSIETAMRATLGAAAALTIGPLPPGDKVRQYTSDLHSR